MEQDGVSKREWQSSKRFTKGITRVCFAIVAICFIVYIVYARSNVEGAGEVLKLNEDNYHNTTAIMVESDVDICQKHLQNLQTKVPPYIKIVTVTSDNGIARCLSVKFAVIPEELKKVYFTETRSFDTIKDDILKRNLATEEELEEMLK